MYIKLDIFATAQKRVGISIQMWGVDNNSPYFGDVIPWKSITKTKSQVRLQTEIISHSPLYLYLHPYK
jgi:hypothetical protein